MGAEQARTLEERILWEHDGVLAVDKPPDLPTSGRTLEDTDCLQWQLMQRHGGSVWAVHQLDADTSGVNLFTTEKRLVEPLKMALGHELAEKRYIAWVHGHPSWEEVSCIAPIGPVGTAGTARGGSLGVPASADARGARHARSTFRVVARSEDERAPRARVEATIGTGRTHQIRIHLWWLGHSLIGEEWYRETPCREHWRQALHAVRLRLGPPFELEFAAAVPVELEALLEG